MKRNFYKDDAGAWRSIPRQRRPDNLPVTIDDFVAVEGSSCLIYKYALEPEGYPTNHNTHGRPLRVLLDIVDIPELEVNHECVNKACGLHIRADTHQANIDDRAVARRHLSEGFVGMLKYYLIVARRPIDAVARRFGVSARYCRFLRNGEQRADTPIRRPRPKA